MAKKPKAGGSEIKIEKVLVSGLKPHPKNYRKHPEDQIEHLTESIGEHGFYRNVVISKDGVILAGHGVVEAAKKMGMKEIPVVRLGVKSDDPRAIKVLVGDNEIGHLGEVDDRALSEILMELKDADVDNLLGTGYDEKMLASLIYVTRPESEIKDLDVAAHFVGMPDYGDSEKPINIVISFRNEDDRKAFTEKCKLKILKKESRSWSTWWPEKQIDDATSVRFTS